VIREAQVRKAATSRFQLGGPPLSTLDQVLSNQIGRVKMKAFPLGGPQLGSYKLISLLFSLAAWIWGKGWLPARQK
jgi:hypothetical protein